MKWELLYEGYDGRRRMKCLQFIKYSLIFAMFWGSLIVSHEVGHALTARMLDDVEVSIFVWPGVQIYPEIGARYPAAWPPRNLATTFVINNSRSVSRERQMQSHILTLFMGSGFTLLLSIIAMAIIQFLRPAGLVLRSLLFFSLFYIDILAYTVFPYFFELRHLVFWGSGNPEPIRALAYFRVDHRLAVALILLICTLLSVWLYFLMMRAARERAADGSLRVAALAKSPISSII